MQYQKNVCRPASMLYLNFRTTADNKKILSLYSKKMKVSESELLNRMISIFKGMEVDMFSCLLNSHATSPNDDE